MRAIAIVVGVVLLGGCAGADEATTFRGATTTAECATPEGGSGGEDAGQAPEAAPTATDAGPAREAAPDAGPEACVPHCPAGVTCGVADDGCGGQMECGTCSDPHESCGGGGHANVCGCTKVGCTAGQSCGPVVPDNCGGTQNCGEPPVDAICENGAVLSFPTLGCTQWHGDPACAGAPGPVMNCVQLIHAGAQIFGLWLCPPSVPLPPDLCTIDSADTLVWACCLAPGCP